jgi:hypothetical protein
LTLCYERLNLVGRGKDKFEETDSKDNTCYKADLNGFKELVLTLRGQ